MIKTAGMRLLVILLAITLLVPLFGCTLAPDEPTVADPELQRVIEAWQVILDNAIDRDSLDTDALSEAAIEGMLDYLNDPYAAYLGKEARDNSEANFEGKTGGIGATVTYKDEQLIIVETHSGSPAEAAGIRQGDIIVAVDGILVETLTYYEALIKVRGEVGAAVTLQILHDDAAEPVTMTIVRGEIELTSVRWELMEDIAYVRISNFSERTADELSEKLTEVAESAAIGIVLDLRGNPGGRLGAVIDVVSQFIDGGTILFVEDSDGELTEYTVRRGWEVTDLPMVILVNEYTASGGEVVSGVLQQYQRAVVAGNVTFGKGSVNQMFGLTDGSGVYVSIARWLLPDGERIEGEGIIPDYRIDTIGDGAIEWAIDYLCNLQPGTGTGSG
jgi:carboxyl-terminal processing protease